MECPPALPDVARWLHQHFRQPPAEFEAGRRKLRAAIADFAGCSNVEAGRLLLELEREGYVRYSPEGRSIGGTAGAWLIYPSPGANPQEEPGARP